MARLPNPVGGRRICVDPIVMSAVVASPLASLGSPCPGQSAPKQAAPDPSLRGVKVSVLVTFDLGHATRLLVEAGGLLEAGAALHVVMGLDVDLPEQIAQMASVTHVTPMAPSLSRFRPYRIAQNPWRSLRSHQRLRPATLTVPADILWSVNLDTLWAGACAAARLGAAAVYEPHKIWFEQAGLQPWQRAVWRAIERRFIGRADSVIACSQVYSSYLRQLYGSAIQGPVWVCHCAAAGDPQKPTDAHVPVRVFFQGVFTADRGLDALVDAFGEPGAAAVLCLQGWGPLESDLRNQVRAKGLDDVISFEKPCGPMATAEAANEHDIGVVGVNPSPELTARHAEQVVLVLGGRSRHPLSGSPVAARDCGQIRMRDDHSSNGRPSCLATR